jgi:hypothetical protein
MARPQVEEGGDALQVWRVAVNILKKQSRTAGKGWSSGLVVGPGVTTPHHKKLACYENVQKTSNLDGFLG